MEATDIISSGLLELYVLGIANEQETVQVTLWAKQYPEVAAEIAAIEAGMETYAMLNAVTPSTASKEKVMGRINASYGSPETKVVAIRPFWKYAAAASVILFIGSAILNLVYYNKYQAATKDYAAAMTEKNNIQNQLTAMEQSNDEMKNNWKIVQSKYSQLVSLNGMDKTPDAAAKIFWMKNTGEVYIDPSNLPDAPDGMQYQFWGIVDGKPVDGGLIINTKKGNKYTIQKMKSFGKAQAFAVTLETAGGHEQPQGQMFVMGKM